MRSLQPVRTEVRAMAALLKHSPGGKGHDQRRHGRKGAGRISGQIVREGGITIRDRLEPKKGYAVSPYPDRELMTPITEFGPKTVEKYRRDNADLLSKPDHYLGGWVQEYAGMDIPQVFLDISVVKATAGAAKRIAVANRQYAIFDLAGGKEIEVDSGR